MPELQQKVAPTVGSEVSAVAPGAAPSLRPAQSLTVVAAPAASLPCAPDAQAFGHLLGVQVSLFARDGMQQAELRLNPPETGPIGVQIEIVGNDARVNFHAAQALTREAIERALPELAAALRDEGLTLTGGSVSDRPADAQGDRSAPQARSARRDANVTMDAPRSVAAPPSRQAALGRIDLYA
ncbi:MAG TPA: flagellar hook-length control protein FliK [Burkholderiaceae bacterium]|nr:flagellar hook-length control protein FliK [Burkholderiaceae bacterium]